MATSNIPQLNDQGFKKKSFWKKPEGVVGTIFLIAILAGLGYAAFLLLPILTTIVSNILYLTIMLLVLGVIAYMIFDPRMRTLISYMYKSAMRKITSIFVTIDPIGILKNYVDDLSKNLRNMSQQIGEVRGQARKLGTIISDNEKEIEKNMAIAHKARSKNMDKEMVLASRRAARLEESNTKYTALKNKLEVLERVLKKMYDNSEILLEDTKDQVKVKEEERKAIHASHSAMKSAMNVIKGDNDKRVMFDRALEVIADDVALKVGEMERFMEMSSSFMNSIDLQQGIFEDKGLQMLEEWEQESQLMLDSGKISHKEFDLDSLSPGSSKGEAIKQTRQSDEDSNYDNLFE